MAFSFVSYRILRSMICTRHLKRALSSYRAPYSRQNAADNSLKDAHEGRSQSFVEDAFKEEDKVKIIELLNSLTEIELKKTKCASDKIIANIVNHRQEYGEFKNLFDVQNVNGLGYIKLMWMCTKLLEIDPMKIMNSRRRSQRIITKTVPKISPAECQDVESIVALRVFSNALTYVHMDRDLQLKTWERVDIFEKPSRYNHILYNNRVSELVDNLPEADAYVLEEKIYRPKSLRVFPHLLDNKLLEALLVMSLNSKPQVLENRVYYLKPSCINKTFNLGIRDERVSPRELVLNNLEGNGQFLNNVYIPEELTNAFHDGTSVLQFEMADVLLIALAFYRAVIFKELMNLP